MYQKRKIRKEKRENSNQNEKFHKVVLNWYPGHMAKTKTEIKNKLDLIDIVYELVDARIPFSSKLRDIDSVIKNKPRILVMTKKDLCDIDETNKWAKYYEQKGYKVLLLDLTNNKDYKKLIDLTSEVTKYIQEKRKDKGLNKKEIKVLVIGVPNVGKSTLINQLANRKVAQTGNKPGVTRQLNWLKTNYGILLLDSPGILWPKLESDTIALNLAATSAIKSEIVPINDVSYYILKLLSDNYPKLLKNRYKIDKISGEVESDYETIGTNLGLIKLGNEVDYEKVSNFIINDVKSGLVKGITLDRYE